MRWSFFKKFSICVDKMDNVYMGMQKRTFFRHWKTEVFGLGLANTLKNMAATSFSVKFENDDRSQNTSANGSANKSWVGKLSGKFSGMMKNRKGSGSFEDQGW
jgi:hypothetical protein